MKNLLKNLNIQTTFTETIFNNIYSLHLKSNNLPLFSNGKGWSKEEAINSAFGEMCERVLTKNYFEDYFLKDIYPDAKKLKIKSTLLEAEFLNKELKKFYEIENLEKEDLIDFSSCSDEILVIPFYSLEGEKIYFPINLIQNLYASNGMAFHLDKKRAFENGLSEIIERFVKFEVIKNGLNLPKIEHYLNNKYIQIYDASLNKYPVVVIAYHRDRKILLSFASDISQEKAIKKAYAELMQGRNSFEEIGEISHNLDEVKDSFNLENHFISNYGLVHSNFLKENKNKPYKWDFKNFKIDKKLYFREYSYRIGYKNYFAYHIIVPDFSEIYPINDLIFNNRNRGKFYRDLVLNYKEFEIDFIIESLEELNPYLNLGDFIGVIFDKEVLVIDFINMLKSGRVELKIDKEQIELQHLVNRLNYTFISDFGSLI